jgi:hypothetical protein
MRRRRDWERTLPDKHLGIEVIRTDQPCPQGCPNTLIISTIDRKSSPIGEPVEMAFAPLDFASMCTRAAWSCLRCCARTVRDIGGATARLHTNGNAC